MRNLSLEPRPIPTDPVRPPAPSMSFSSPASSPRVEPVKAPKIAVLGPTLRFKGELSAQEDFILQGRIEGSINHTQSVTIGVEGSVLGNIHARVITIEGTVDGDLHAQEAVIVQETGRVTGNIHAPRVGLVDGAFFNGRIEMPERPQAKRTSSAPNRMEAPPPGVPMTAEDTERLLLNRK